MSSSLVEEPDSSMEHLRWLQAEYSRLGFECQYMEAHNLNLRHQLEDAPEEMIHTGPAAARSQSCHSDLLEVLVQDVFAPSEQAAHVTEPSPEEAMQEAVERTASHLVPFARQVSLGSDDMNCKHPDGSEKEGPVHQGVPLGASFNARKMMRSRSYMNAVVMSGSALGKSRPVQVMIYLLAFGGVAFVLLATATELGVHHEGDDHHRRLGGPVNPLGKATAFTIVGAGLISFFLNIVGQPLILGYLLGGALVGPLCLGIVDFSYVAEISQLGLLFLIFSIGMEVDFHRLGRMDRVALVVGFLHVPISAGAMYAIIAFLNEMTGLHLGEGSLATLYVSVTCAISSNIIVEKMLAGEFHADLPAGRLTHSILVCQDIWAIIILAFQPTLASPSVSQMASSIAMIVVLLIIAFGYAKFVMPPVLHSAKQSVELMLVLSMSWCFFLCSAAILPFVNLSMEVAALIAGTALATFPYSQDMNSKITYIRDFFITIFFASVGIQLSVPTWMTLTKAFFLVGLVLVIRWVGICALCVAVGGELRQGAVATINLSQISELVLVIASLGMKYHINEETMAILVWAFIILAIASPYALGYSSVIVRAMASVGKRVTATLRGCRPQEDTVDEPDVLDEEGEADIIFLGFHRTASMLIAEFQLHNPEMLDRIHVIDIEAASLSTLREKGVKCTWGDFASAKELTRCHRGEATLVLSTIPDSLMQGVTNMKLLKTTKSVWPSTLFIATGDDPHQAEDLYMAGADYVVRMEKLGAERLHGLLSEHCTKAYGSCELNELFEQYKGRDKDARTRKGFLSQHL